MGRVGKAKIRLRHRSMLPLGRRGGQHLAAPRTPASSPEAGSHPGQRTPNAVTPSSPQPPGTKAINAHESEIYKPVEEKIRQRLTIKKPQLGKDTLDCPQKVPWEEKLCWSACPRSELDMQRRERQVPPEIREDWVLVEHTSHLNITVLFLPKSLLDRPSP